MRRVIVLGTIVGCLALPFPATGAAAVQAPATLVSTSDTGVKGDGHSQAPDLSSSGHVVAFESMATTLDPADTDPGLDVYAKDTTTDELILVSSSDAGVKGNALSVQPAISGDGRLVAFYSEATNLDPADTDAVPDIYLKDLTSGDVSLVSTSDAGVNGNGFSLGPDLTDTGSKVSFYSAATNLDPGDTDGVFDVYVKDVATGDLTLASVTQSGVNANDVCTLPTIAPSGTRVAFQCAATNLDPRDTDSTTDVYAKDLTTGELFLVSTSSVGGKGNGVSQDPSVSSAGNRVAFSSVATNLDPADTDLVSDIYVKNLATGTLRLLSTSDDGVKGNGLSRWPVLSADGRRVAFASASTNLDPADTDTNHDVYVKDLATGDIALAATTVDGVKSNTGSTLPAISGEGRRVAFQSSATNLDPADTDQTLDIYLKRPQVCTIVGTAGADFLVGTTGNDVICGRGGNDSLFGVAGADVLLGEGGDDLLAGGAGADVMDGGGGAADLLDYTNSPAGVEVHVRLGVAFGSEAEGDTFAAVENVYGSEFADSLFGDSGPNLLQGRGGSDVLAGDTGNDVLSGGEDDDFLAGGPGADELDGGLAGTPDLDTVTYGESPAAVVVNLATGVASGGNATGDTFDEIDSVAGSPHADDLTGDGGANTLAGGAGDDVLVGGVGADILVGDSGLDLLSYAASTAAVTVNLAAQTVTGGTATGDVISTVEGAVGSAFPDTLTGGTADNVFMGMGGADVMAGAGGNDAVYYLYSPAGVTVDLAAQTASGGHATGDVISGFEDALGSVLADVLSGSNGPNELQGLGGDDTLRGLGGDDTLLGGVGLDAFDGGTGADSCDETAGEPVVSCDP